MVELDHFRKQMKTNFGLQVFEKFTFQVHVLAKIKVIDDLFQNCNILLVNRFKKTVIAWVATIRVLLKVLLFVIFSLTFKPSNKKGKCLHQIYL